jgi:intracellular multiplication protein IcmL
MAAKLNQKNHQKLGLIKTIYLSVGLNFIVIFALFYVFTHRAVPDYYSTSANGKYQLITGIDMPNTSDSAVLEWASLVAISCYTYDFVNYKDQLDKLSIYFTDNGWSGFSTELNSSNVLDVVVGKKLIVNSVITKPPIILQKGWLNGNYAWRVQIPLLVTYQAASDFSSENMLVNILVRRISTLESYKGLGIEQFVSGHYDIFEG